MCNKILLIGSSGYIGSRFVKFAKNKINLLRSHINLNKKKKRIINILNYKELDNYLFKNKSIKTIVNLSGQYGKDFKKISLNGNKNLIKIAKKYNLNILFLSSTLVYGNKKNHSNEKAKPNPKNNYSKVKYLIENLYFQSDINYVILRSSNVYDDLFEKKGLLKNINDSFKYQKKFKCDDLNRVRNFIHINDFNNLLLRILKSSKTFNKKTVNFSSQNFKINEIIDLFSEKYKFKINVTKLKKKKSEDFDNYIDNKMLLKYTKYKKFTKLQNVIRSIRNYE